MPESGKLKLPFHYIKGNYFRPIHVDGIIGNVTPAGLIFAALYSERASIPQLMVHVITESGQIGPEVPEDRQAKSGVVRDVEVGAIMSVETAKSVVDWLRTQIDLVERLRKAESPHQGPREPQGS